MKILHISDTHGFHGYMSDKRFQNIDVVIHSGDCSNYMDPARNANEVLDFIEWYKNVPVLHKIYVAGNHDTSIEKGLVKPIQFTEAGIIYLQNSSIIIDGIKFWGSPFTPRFGDWAFMKKRETIGREWENIPEDTEVLIVHGPPKGIRDLTYDRQNDLEMCGDSSLLKKIKTIQPKLICFGHIHNTNDIENQGTSTYSIMPNTIFSNAACVEDGKFEYGLTSFGNILTIN